MRLSNLAVAHSAEVIDENVARARAQFESDQKRAQEARTRVHELIEADDQIFFAANEDYLEAVKMAEVSHRELFAVDPKAYKHYGHPAMGVPGVGELMRWKMRRQARMDRIKTAVIGPDGNIQTIDVDYWEN